MLSQSEIKGALEALLLTAEDNITVNDIKKATNFKKKDIKKALQAIKNDCEAKDRGIKLAKFGSGYKLQNKKEYSSFIECLHKPELNKKLSQAALETLAIIAYKQPVTRAEIESIRGVNVEKALKTLRKRMLIKEVGRKETIGNPIVYGTTESFLEYMGLESLNELPKPEKFHSLKEKE